MLHLDNCSKAYGATSILNRGYNKLLNVLEKQGVVQCQAIWGIMASGLSEVIAGIVFHFEKSFW